MFKTHLVNGNKAITALRNAYRNVNKKHAKKKNYDSVPFDDAPDFVNKILGGLFQNDSTGGNIDEFTAGTSSPPDDRCVWARLPRSCVVAKEKLKPVPAQMK